MHLKPLYVPIEFVNKIIRYQNKVHNKHISMLTSISYKTNIQYILSTCNGKEHFRRVYFLSEYIYNIQLETNMGKELGWNVNVISEMYNKLIFLCQRKENNMHLIKNTKTIRHWPNYVYLFMLLVDNLTIPASLLKLSLKLYIPLARSSVSINEIDEWCLSSIFEFVFYNIRSINLTYKFIF